MHNGGLRFTGEIFLRLRKRFTSKRFIVEEAMRTVTVVAVAIFMRLRFGTLRPPAASPTTATASGYAAPGFI
jgi:hypothetical protein